MMINLQKRVATIVTDVIKPARGGPRFMTHSIITISIIITKSETARKSSSELWTLLILSDECHGSLS